MPFGLRLGLGSSTGTGITSTNIFTDSNIVVTFSEAVDPLTVTNVGDGSGSFELYNNTADAWVAGALSTSDNIQWTFNPTSDFSVGDSLTLTLTDAIEDGTTGDPYAGPFTFKYLVVNRLPTTDTFVIEAASATANISITSVTGSDPDSEAVTFGISETDDSSTVTTWQNEAAWQAAGFDSSAVEGLQTITLYAFTRDASGGISTAALSDSCDVTITDTTAPTMTAFTVEATSSDANIAILTLAATDNVGVASYQVNESATPPAAGAGTWQSAATWISNGYDTGMTEGQTATKTLYAYAKDAANNVSTSLNDSCDVDVEHYPSFAVQPTVNTELYDGATIDFTLADTLSDNLDVDYWDGSAWQSLLTNVASGAYAQTNVVVDGLAAGNITYLKLRAYDNGDTNYITSNLVTAFDTVAPTLTSVTPADTKNTLVFADNANDTADSFNIHWGTSTGVLTNTISSVTSPYDHTSLTNGTEYFYEIVAIEGGLESTASTEKSGTPSAVTAFASDDFNDTNGTNLVGKALDVGGTWADLGGMTSFDSATTEDGLGVVVETGTSAVGGRIVAETSNADCTITANCSHYLNTARSASGDGQSGVVFRAADSDNFWEVRSFTSSSIGLYKIVAGSGSWVGASYSLSGAQTIDIEVVLSGSSITVDINTVEAWSITDSDLSSNTKHGLVFVSKNNDAGTVDDFLVE